MFGRGGGLAGACAKGTERCQRHRRPYQVPPGTIRYHQVPPGTSCIRLLPFLIRGKAMHICTCPFPIQGKVSVYYQVPPGTRYLRRTRYQVPGIRYQVPGTTRYHQVPVASGLCPSLFEAKPGMYVLAPSLFGGKVLMYYQVPSGTRYLRYLPFPIRGKARHTCIFPFPIRGQATSVSTSVISFPVHRATIVVCQVCLHLPLTYSGAKPLFCQSPSR